MILRRSRPSDIEGIIALFSNVYQKMPYDSYASESEWQTFIDSNHSYVIEEDNKIVGHGALSIKGDTGVLCRTAIHEDYRGRNYYDLLVDKRMNMCRKNMLTKIDTFVTTHNNIAQTKLRGKYGFQPIGLQLLAIPDIAGIGQKGSLVHMRKYLSGDKQIPSPENRLDQVPQLYDDRSGNWSYQTIPDRCEFNKIQLDSAIIEELNVKHLF